MFRVLTLEHDAEFELRGEPNDYGENQRLTRALELHASPEQTGDNDNDKTKCTGGGEVQSEHCTDFDAHTNRKNHQNTFKLRKLEKLPSVKPRQAKIKARTKTPNNEEQYAATCLSTPKNVCMAQQTL